MPLRLFLCLLLRVVLGFNETRLARRVAAAVVHALQQQQQQQLLPLPPVWPLPVPNFPMPMPVTSWQFS